MFSLRLPPALEKRLEQLALLRDKTKTALVVEAVDAFLTYAEEYRQELSEEESKGQAELLKRRQYEELKERITNGGEKTQKQVTQIFDWMASGNPWTKKPDASAQADGCPHGRNYITGYTFLNEDSSEETVAVVCKNADGPRGINTRFQRIIPFDIWKERMMVLKTNN